MDVWMVCWSVSYAVASTDRRMGWWLDGSMELMTASRTVSCSDKRSDDTMDCEWDERLVGELVSCWVGNWVE